jgi:putative redox protein
MDNHKITARFDSGLSFISTIDQHSLIMDSSDPSTESIGPSPKKLMLAALAGCTGIDVVSILEKMKVKFTDLNISVNATLTEEHPQIYKTVDIVFDIKINENDQPKMEKAVLLSKDKYCGVSSMFNAFAQLNWTINYL